MDSDLISRSALLELAHNHVGGTVDCNDIARFPTVDAEVVRHGRWIDMQEDDTTEGMWRCSACGFDGYFDILTPEECGTNYCPNCGAKMDGDVNVGK